jgi:eukaryotic-like serine/threonine-protein kinase
MRAEPGARFGPYEIVDHAGSGGMGEVYRARDTRLGRAVAIKVLPPAMASDPEWRQRLEREARAISSLSHPHICHLYDIGHHEGADFLVMEYLEGETLAARLAGGPLAPDLVLRYSAEIADALHTAHRKGIVHRDLKPGNVMITRGGARLLDFGLAKPGSPAALADGTVHGTVTAPLTAQGTIVGTFHYMSPEQAESREVDARSDIFSLGAVLYEMATGRRAFDGKSPASVIAAVLEREPPPISTLQPLAPAALDDLVRGCLAKDPDDRWQSAHDVRLQLQAIARGPAAAPRAAPPVRRGAMAALAVAVALLLVGAAWMGRATAPSASTGPPLRTLLAPPDAHSFAPHDFAISPDGRRLAFVAASTEGVSTLWVQALDSLQAVQIAGSAGASSPFWSPDSRWVAFFTTDRLLRVEPGTGTVERVADVTLATRPGAWGPDGTILFSRGVYGPIYRVAAAGGAPSTATTIPDDHVGEAHRFPQFLSDGRRFLYVASWTTQRRGGLYLASLDGGEPTLVSADVRGRALLVDGRLLYAQEGIVYAQPFDERRGALTGSPEALIRNELASDTWRFGDLALSASTNGTLVFQSRQTYTTHLVWYDREGNELGIVGSPNLFSPAISPDGTRIAAAYDRAGTGQQSIWVYEIARGVSTIITRDGLDTSHRWSADGRLIAYSSVRATSEGLFRRPADGSGTEERLIESQAHLLLNDVSRDGRLLYMDFSEGDPLLRSYGPDGETHTVGAGAEAAYSPDGAWVSYLRMGSAPSPVVTRAEGGDAPLVQLSAGLGSQPRWRGDSREIYYIAPDKWMMAVGLTVRDGTIEPAAPRRLFRTRIVQPRLVLFQYDVTSDGTRFLVNSLPSEGTAAPLTVLTNWMPRLQ